MPELPEVETSRRGLLPHLPGRRVRAVVLRHRTLRYPLDPALAEILGGKKLLDIRRRAKYLLFDFADGVLLVHLGMSGSIFIADKNTSVRKHDHVDIDFSGQILRYHDPRRFGFMLWQPAGQPIAMLAQLGIEPLDEPFTGAYLHTISRNLRQPVKTFIMDGHNVVGVGNIYASESLFRAGIHPRTPVGRLSLERCQRLVWAIKHTLAQAIEAGGSTLKDFVNSEGKSGYFQHAHQVYGHAGEPCRTCAQPIHKIIQGNRATYYCGKCQFY